MVVEDLEESDLVAKAGVQVGDVILALDGIAIDDHTAAIAYLNDVTGTVIEVTYSTAAEVAKAKAKAADAARKARIKRRRKCCRVVLAVLKYLVLGLSFTAISTYLAYNYLPQEWCKDPVDINAMPRLGFVKKWVPKAHRDAFTELLPQLGEQPTMGFDGRPLRRVLKPKDPTKPWTVSGWSRVKEINAIGRLKKMAFWKEHEATFLGNRLATAEPFFVPSPRAEPFFHISDQSGQRLGVC